MKKRYRLESGMDTNITLEIDTAKITEALAQEINAFWSGADELLERSGGDIFQAAARRAAGPLLNYLLNGQYHQIGAVKLLPGYEGGPSISVEGINIISYEIPTLDARDFEVTEIAG